jgi:hypothetical protein
LRSTDIAALRTAAEKPAWHSHLLNFLNIEASRVLAGDPLLLKGVLQFLFAPTLRRRSCFIPDSKRRRAPLAQLCDAAAFFSDEAVLSRDEQAAEFALNNFRYARCWLPMKNTNVLPVHASREGNNAAT